MACFGEEGYKQEPPEGWEGKMKLPNNIGFINYKIDPNSRKYFEHCPFVLSILTFCITRILLQRLK